MACRFGGATLGPRDEAQLEVGPCGLCACFEGGLEGEAGSGELEITQLGLGVLHRGVAVLHPRGRGIGPAGEGDGQGVQGRPVVGFVLIDLGDGEQRVGEGHPGVEGVGVLNGRRLERLPRRPQVATPLGRVAPVEPLVEGEVLLGRIDREGGLIDGHGRGGHGCADGAQQGQERVCV